MDTFEDEITSAAMRLHHIGSPGAAEDRRMWKAMFTTERAIIDRLVRDFDARGEAYAEDHVELYALLAYCVSLIDLIRFEEHARVMPRAANHAEVARNAAEWRARITHMWESFTTPTRAVVA